MKNKSLSLIIALILIVATLNTVLAISQVQETAATSRIVGDSLDDLKRQLKDDSPIRLEQAIYISPTITFDDISERIILPSIFKINFGVMPLFGRFNWFKDNLSEDRDKIIIFDEPKGGNPTEEIGPFTLSEIKQLSYELSKDDNLVILSSNRSGIYFPDQDSALGEISPGSSTIATTLTPSPLFVSVFLCNLGRQETLGKTFTSTRNNYYLNTPGTIFYNELLGVNMKSYLLYGLPTKELTVPRSSTERFCRDYQEHFYPQANEVYAIAESEGTTISRDFIFEINDYSIEEKGNYSVFVSDEIGNSFDMYELVLLRKTLKEKFPLNTIITTLSATGFSNPVDLTIDDLPMWGLEGYIDRDCIDTTSEASVDFSHIYTEEALEIYPTINPIEVINCSTGEVRLYQTINYKIEYVTNSPVLITEINSSKNTVPLEELTINVALENLRASPVEGYLSIKNQEGEIMEAIPITASSGEYELSFNAPETEDKYTYRVDFYYENESTTFKEFDFEVSVLDLNLRIVEVGEDSELLLEITNNLEDDVDVNISYFLSDTDGIVEDNEDSDSVGSGLNEFEIFFSDLDRTEITYDVFIRVAYEEGYKTTTTTIIVEHAPTIVQPNIIISENETFTITPEVYDVDEDEVDVSIDSLFDNEALIDFDSSGIYDVTITADDGIKQTIKTISLTIENTNRPPILDNMTKIIAKEGENFTFNPVYSDPDNENAVDNDDNNLSLSFSGVLNSTGEQTMNYEASGNYNITVILSDGDYSVSKEVELEIENTNRQPEITTEITIAENSVLNLSDFAFDPDNNNSVSNDDNNLSLTWDDLFDEDGLWNVNYNDSGIYEVNVTVSDGEFNVSEIMTINVSNVNRAPRISTNENTKQYIGEESNTLLNVNAYDLDIEDNVSVSWYIEGNNTEDGLAFLFNPDGETGIFAITAIADDGDLNNETNFEIVVSDVPIFDGLDGDTSQLNASQLDSVEFLILEKTGKVKIIFQEPVDLSETVDFVTTVVLDTAYASLDGNFLEVLEGIPAHVIFYNVDITGNPIIYYDGGFSTEPTSICPSSICSNIEYDSITKTLEFDVAHFSTYGVEGGDGNQFDLDAESITIEDPLTGKIQESFVIENNGLGDLDNLEVTGSFNPGFDLEVSPASTSLPSGATTTITISGEIMNLYTDETLEAGTINFKDNDFERNIKIYISPTDPIQITDLEINLETKSYNNLDDGDEIEIFAGEKMIISIEVENLYKTPVDSDIQIEFSVSEFDEKERVTFDLNNNEKRTKKISIDIPEELKKEEYDLDIKLEAEIEGELDFEIEWEITLEYDEDNENIIIVKTSSSSSTSKLQENTISRNLPITGKVTSTSFVKQLEDLGVEFILVVFFLLCISLIVIGIAYKIRN